MSNITTFESLAEQYKKGEEEYMELKRKREAYQEQCQLELQEACQSSARFIADVEQGVEEWEQENREFIDSLVSTLVPKGASEEQLRKKFEKYVDRTPFVQFDRSKFALKHICRTLGIQKGTPEYEQVKSQFITSE